MIHNLYIHIPFCIKKCLYCDFYSVSYDESLAEYYIDSLCKEINLRKNCCNLLKTIYIGGGTPSVLNIKSLIKLLEYLQNSFNFAHDIEITTEINPGTIDEAKAQTLVILGVNRFSIGVQSFNNEELKFLGRIHNSADALRTIKTLRKYGVNNLSIDLIYGIPGQKIESWEKSLNKAINLSPDHISAYELTLEENTVLYKIMKSSAKRNKSNLSLPDEDNIIDMYNYTIDYLATNYYYQYEISNFAKIGFKCLHNLNYWDRGEYIGLGAGAHSFIDGIRKKNVADINKYIHSLKSDIIPETEIFKITKGEALKEFIFLGLRKTEGIKLDNSFLAIMGNKNKGINFIECLRELIDSGYLEFQGNYLKLTRKGITVSNTIFVKLFEKLGL